MSKKTFYLAFWCLSAAWSAGAQGFTDYPWAGNMAACPTIPEEFLKADAVLIKSETHNTSNFSGTYPYLEQSATYRSQLHAKILTDKGIEDFKRIAIPRFKGRIGDFVQMKYVDVRIRKADGRVEDLSVRNLPKPTLQKGDELYDVQDEYFIYEIPNLAIGDEIERVTVLEAKFADQGRNINLYSEYPTLEARLTIVLPTDVPLKGRTYNNMPQESIKINAAGLREYSWVMTNLPAVPEANSPGSIASERLSYLIYELNLNKYRAEQGIEVKSFGDLLAQYADDFLKVRAGKKKMEEFYTTKVFEGKEYGTLEKFVLLNQYVCNKLKIIGEGELEQSERDQNLEYYLYNNKVTPSVVMQLYRDFFQRYGIEYYLGFGKDRFQGSVDINFPSQTQVSDYFYIVKIDGKQLIVEGLNGINELPVGLWGTTCYFRNIQDYKASLNKIDFGKEMLEDAKNNKRLRRAQWDIGLESGTVNQKVNIELKGLYATVGRSGMMLAHKADTLAKAMERSYGSLFKDAQISVSEATVKQNDCLPPYEFKANFALSAKGLLRPEGDKGYALDLGAWWQHQLRRVVNPERRVLDYHLPFLGSDVEDLVLVFDREVELTNLAELTQKIENEVGSYECRITQPNPKMIRIESRYNLKQLLIPAAQADKLHQINQAFEKMQKTTWLFRAK